MAAKIITAAAMGLFAGAFIALAATDWDPREQPPAEYAVTNDDLNEIATQEGNDMAKKEELNYTRTEWEDGDERGYLISVEGVDGYAVKVVPADDKNGFLVKHGPEGRDYSSQSLNGNGDFDYASDPFKTPEKADAAARKHLAKRKAELDRRTANSGVLDAFMQKMGVGE